MEIMMKKPSNDNDNDSSSNEIKIDLSNANLILTLKKIKTNESTTLSSLYNFYEYRFINRVKLVGKHDIVTGLIIMVHYTHDTYYIKFTSDLKILIKTLIKLSDIEYHHIHNNNNDDEIDLSNANLILTLRKIKTKPNESEILSLLYNFYEIRYENRPLHRINVVDIHNIVNGLITVVHSTQYEYDNHFVSDLKDLIKTLIKVGEIEYHHI